MAARGREAAKKARDLTRKKDSMSVGEHFLENLQIAKVKTQQLANFIWWKEILQAVVQNKAETV